jgi:hypothetical protein
MRVHKDDEAANMQDTLKQVQNKWEKPATVHHSKTDLFMVLHGDGWVEEGGF